MSTCIYCQRSSDEEFPTEHVLPQMFGRFKNNLTLQSVCGDCNNEFSRLEISFGRDSAEAVQRLRYGLKPMAEAKQVGRKRLKDTFINVPGSHHGSRIRLTGEDDLLGAQATPQVGFQKEGEETVWIDEENLTANRVAPFKSGYKRVVLGSSQEELDRLEAKLRELGLELTDSRPLEPPVDDGEKIDVVTKYIFDDVVLRVVAKIVFNYTAYSAGSEFMLHNDFDQMREYIRFGVRPPWQPVVPTNDKILFDESVHWRRGKLHLVTVGWSEASRSVLGQVSLFNQFTYRSALCVGFKGIWRPIKSGHAYSLIDWQVKRLASIS